MTDGRLRVLYSVPEPSAASNPYTTILAQRIADVADVDYFSWRIALSRRHDIFHVHWPETLVRSPGRLRRFARATAGIAYIALLELRGTVVIQTVHNVTPHEPGGWVERLFLRLLARRVDHSIYLNGTAQGAKSSVVLHSHYGDWPQYRVGRPPRQRTALMFGALRRYKQVEVVVNAFKDVGAASDIELRIAGAGVDGDYVKELSALADGAGRVRLDTRRIPDPELAEMIAAAAVVVLPYKDFYNSGAALLALSMCTPILAPRTPSTESLQREVGEEWVLLYDGGLDSTDLVSAVEEGMRLEGCPDLSSRNWEDAARAHMEIYYRTLTERAR